MTSEQIRLALIIAETGSISGAAKKLYLTQPTVSGTLAALEREIGYPLFHRSVRGITPTAEGLEFLRSARRIVKELDSIMLLQHQGETFHLHVTSFSSTRMERAFIQLCLNHQNLRRLDISYEVQSCSIERAAALLYDGLTDIVLLASSKDITDTQQQLLSSYHLAYEFIGQMPLAVTMAPTHPLSKGELTLERAASFTRLEGSNAQPHYAVYPSSTRMLLKQSPSIKIHSRTMRMQLAATGIGFFLGMPVRENELSQYNLTCRIIPDHHMHLFAIYSMSAADNPYLKEFLSLVHQEYANDPFFLPLQS